MDAIDLQTRGIKWLDAEKEAITRAYQVAKTAEEFFKIARSVPGAPFRSSKAYAERLYLEHPTHEARRTPLFLDIKRVVQQEWGEKKRQRKEAKKSAPASSLASKAEPSSSAGGASWLDEIDIEPVAPPPRPVAAPKPDPAARLPRHIPVPPAHHVSFALVEVARLLMLDLATVEGAIRSRKLPFRTVYGPLESKARPVVTRSVFDVLHAALSDGHSFEHACLLACEKHPAPKPLVPAEMLYAVSDSLNDPNPDAQEAFTVEQAATALGLSSTFPLTQAINNDGFPAMRVSGKLMVGRADLLKLRSLQEQGLTFMDAAKRVGMSVISPPVTDTGDEQLPPPPAEIYVPEIAAAEERQWTLEALNEGVLTVEQALKIAGVTDAPRNRWALGLLGRGDIDLVQAAKILR